MEISCPNITKDQVSNIIVPTSRHAIVKDGNDGEENIKTGEDYEEKVERVSHLLGRKYKNYQKIAQDANTSNKGLK